MLRHLAGALPLAISLISVSAVRGQDQDLVSRVPVFRYSLQSWDPNLYDVYVFYKGEFNAQGQDLLGTLYGSLEKGMNWEVSPINVDEQLPAKFKEIHDQAKIRTYPFLVVRYPNATGPGGTAWAGAMTPENINGLANSQAQQTVIKRLLAGDSGVWVLVESNNKNDNDAAFKALQQHISKAQRELKLQDHLIQGDEKYDFDVTVPLTLKFSAIRVSAKDVFGELLLGTDELKEYADEGHPVAFAVFGRGRVLPGIPTADDIKEGSQIQDACKMLAGPVYDPLKENHGRADLPLAINWNEQIRKKAAPPKTNGNTNTKNAKDTKQVKSNGNTKENSNTKLRNDPGPTKTQANTNANSTNPPVTNGNDTKDPNGKAPTPPIVTASTGEPSMIWSSLLVLVLVMAMALVGLSMKEAAG